MDQKVSPTIGEDPILKASPTTVCERYVRDSFELYLAIYSKVRRSGDPIYS